MTDLRRPMLASQYIEGVSHMPEGDDMIEALLPAGETMIVTGGPYLGKSLEVQRLACQFPIGGDYHGLKVKQAECLYVTWEGSLKGVGRRFKKLLAETPLGEPVIYRASDPMFLNQPDGVAAFERILKTTREIRDVKVVICDSFTYTVMGDTKKDEVMNPWWAKVQWLSVKHGITFIFVWEMTKPLVFQGLVVDPFNLARLKTSYSSAYKVNTVVALGDVKEMVWSREEKKAIRTAVCRQIVVMKAKDMGRLSPLRVELDQTTLAFNGQHWEKNPVTDEYDAVDGPSGSTQPVQSAQPIVKKTKRGGKK